MGGVLALVLVGSACTGDDGVDGVAGTEDGVTTSEAVLAPATRVMAGDEAGDLEILEDRILIPASHELANVAVDDVIALGVTEQTPNGLLRLVTGVTDEGGQVAAATRQATLGEAFDELEVSASVPVRFERIVPAAEGDGQAAAADATTLTGDALVAPAAFAGPAARETAPLAAGTIDVEETGTGFVASFEEILYNGDDDTSTPDDQVTLSGSVAVDVVLNAELDVDVDLVDVDVDLESALNPFSNPLSVADPKLERAKLEIEGNVSTSLQLDARQATPPFDRDTEVFAIEGSPILIPAGPTVIPVRLRMPIVVSWSGQMSAAADTSVTTSTQVRLGVEYQDGDWDSIDFVDHEHDFNPPELDDADPGSVELRAGPRIEIRVWEALASGSVGVDGTVQIDLLRSPPWACLYAGYRAPVGFTVLGESPYDKVLRQDRTLLLPDECNTSASLPEDVVPVSGYSRVYGTCTPLGVPVNEAGRMVAATGDGGVMVASSSEHEGLWLLRLDAAGNVLWTRTYPEDAFHLAGLVPTGQGFIVAFENGRMLFLGHRGDVLDARRLGDGAFQLRRLSSLPGASGFLAVGEDSPGPVVAELRPDGTARWARSYTGDLEIGDARAASRRDDGGWNIAVGHSDFLAVDQNGELERAVRLLVDEQPPRRSEMTGGAAGTLAALVARHEPFEPTRGAVVIVDADLETAVGRNRGPAASGKSVYGRADGDFVSAGGTDDGLIVGRVSSGGALRWLVAYGAGDEPSVPPFPGVTSTTDGGVVTVGRTWSLATERCGDDFEGKQSDLWVVKVPSTGQMTPTDESGLQRTNLTTEVVDWTYELVPIVLDDEPHRLEVTDDDLVRGVANYPTVDSHLPDLADTPVQRTIPAGLWQPETPIRVTYEYAQGQPASERITVAWDGDTMAVTYHEADVYNEGAPQGTFRYTVNPDVMGSCYLGQPTTCAPTTPRVLFTDVSAFFPGPGANIPRFEGTLPAIEVNRTETHAGLEVACGRGVDEVWEWGEMELCVHEATGVILYAYTVEQCNRDETDPACVELVAVDVADPTPDDFAIPRFGG